MKLNQIQCIGRLGGDAVVKEHNGQRFVSFTLAVDDSYRDSYGNKVESVIWYSCAANYESYKNTVQYLTKGREVFVQGNPKAKGFLRKDNTPDAGIQIRVTLLQLGASPTDRPESSQQTPVSRPVTNAPVPPSPAPTTVNSDIGALADDNEGLPF